MGAWGGVEGAEMVEEEKMEGTWRCGGGNATAGGGGGGGGGGDGGGGNAGGGGAGVAKGV